MTEIIELWSMDRFYGVQLDLVLLDQLVEICKKAGDYETGGIIVGYYDKENHLAVLSKIRLANDSRQGKAWFVRGRGDLSTWLQKIYSKGLYYLGEWHFHPYGQPHPSLTDTNEMLSIASSEEYHCPEPLLIIISSNLQGSWSLGVHLFLHGQDSSRFIGRVNFVRSV